MSNKGGPGSILLVLMGLACRGQSSKYIRGLCQVYSYDVRVSSSIKLHKDNDLIFRGFGNLAQQLVRSDFHS